MIVCSVDDQGSVACVQSCVFDDVLPAGFHVPLQASYYSESHAVIDSCICIAIRRSGFLCLPEIPANTRPVHPPGNSC